MAEQTASGVMARLITNSQESCPDCAADEADGWVPIEEMKEIGSRECQWFCKCDIEFSDDDGTMPDFTEAAVNLVFGIGDSPAVAVVDDGILPHNQILPSHRAEAAMRVREVKNPAIRQLAEDTYAQAIADGVKVPNIGTNSFKGSNASAMYSASNDKIFVSSKLNAKSAEMFQANVKSGWLAQPNPILHELGHKVHSDALGNMYDNAKNFYFSDAQKALIKEKVSRYAAVNALEFAAEVWSGVSSGKVYSEEIMALFKRVTNGKVVLRRGK